MRNIRINLFMVTTILICIGIVMIYSASSVYAYERWHDSFYFLKRHLLYIFIGIILSVIIMKIDYTKLRSFTKPIMLITLFTLILVLIPGLGSQISGARRWFRFWIFSFQPSEIAKFTFILYAADYLSRKQFRINTLFKGFLPVSFILGLLVGLILLQPDLGTAFAIVIVAFVMFFVSGINLWFIGASILASIPLLYILIFKVGYRKKRILAFLNPWQDPRGISFQIVQSFVALGSGGLFGVGLGASRQKLYYLPASHTDFIFSIIGEELGLLGTLSIVILFILFIWHGMKIAFYAKDTFGQLLSLGLVSMIGLEAIINIAVASGSVPTKGLPLPFISYGGSSLIFNIMSVALLLNIAKDRIQEMG